MKTAFLFMYVSFSLAHGLIGRDSQLPGYSAEEYQSHLPKRVLHNFQQQPVIGRRSHRAAAFRECLRTHCQNGGTCITTGLFSYKCTCTKGYTGKDCQLRECIHLQFIPQEFQIFEKKCTKENYVCALENFRPMCKCFSPRNCNDK